MTKIFYDQDADIKALEGKTVAVIGYGNQGRSQALNLRDSGVKVIVGNIDDHYRPIASGDGFAVTSIADAVKRAEVAHILIPDEVQPEVFGRDIQPNLKPAAAVCFSSGYNFHFGFLDCPSGVDLIMVAPKMIGAAVRSLFLEGSGGPALVAVERDATGHAWAICLAIAAGIGSTRVGAVESSFAEEAETDLFAEQAMDGAMLYSTAAAYEALCEAGYNPDVALLELYLSGEMVEISRAVARVGLFRQTDLHSTTSQYGQLTTGRFLFPPEAKKGYLEVIRRIRSGEFAREWTLEQIAGGPVFRRLKAEAFAHPINEAEKRVRRLFNLPGYRDDEPEPKAKG